MYIAIDPGGSTGWATFDKEGQLKAFGKIKGENEFLDWLEAQDGYRVYIVEIYRNRGGIVNSWSKGPTQQHIGAIKRIAHKKGIRIVEQEPSPALSMGLRFIGLHTTYKGKHVPDDVSALAHGTYYLRKEGIQK